LLIDDATPEAIIQSLATVWPIGFLATNEGGSFFGGHGMKDESIMRNLAMFNQRWDGGRSKIMRSKAEPLEVDGVRLAACVMVQPSMMRKFMQSAGDAARGSGFLARFLIAWPESTQGYRPYKAPGAMLALESLNRRMTELLDTAPPLTPMHRVAPFTLELNAEGFEAWRDVYNVIESNLAQHGEYADIRDSASKAADNVARIAAVFHATEGTMGKIGADSINAAAEVVLWHLSETQRLFGGIVVDEPIQLAQSLESWLVSRGDAPMPLNEILQRVPNRKMRKKIVRDEAIGVLVSHGRARVIDVGGSSAIELHPSFFEEKA
jgi:putative DNA primase/helicase